MNQIDTRYLKTNNKMQEEQKKSSMLANRKGGIFLLICALIGMTFDVITLVGIISSGDNSRLGGVVIALVFGVALIVWSIIMIANDPKNRKVE